LEQFFKPGEEILVADAPDQVLEYLVEIPDREVKHIGQRARARVLAEHTAEHRAAELESYVSELA
jgi:spore maturation protein CgeB